MKILKQRHTEYDWEELTEEQARADLAKVYDDPEFFIEKLKTFQIVRTADAEYMLAPGFVEA